MTPGMHKCPKDGCEVELSSSVLACRLHWYDVPAPLRSAVNRTWRSGDTRAYLAARAAAVKAMNR